MAVRVGLSGDGGGWSVNNGLSTHALSALVYIFYSKHRHTRLWSMISEMTAIWPSWGPDLRRTTEEIDQGQMQTTEEHVRTTADLDEAGEVGWLVLKTQVGKYSRIEPSHSSGRSATQRKGLPPSSKVHPRHPSTRCPIHRHISLL